MLLNVVLFESSVTPAGDSGHWTTLLTSACESRDRFHAMSETETRRAYLT